jgi:hypothetical protein
MQITDGTQQCSLPRARSFAALLINTPSTIHIPAGDVKDGQGLAMIVRASNPRQLQGRLPQSIKGIAGEIVPRFPQANIEAPH